MDHQVPVPRPQLRRLADELATALRAVTEARAASDALDVLTQITVAIEELSATQHELVNVLLDHGHSWSRRRSTQHQPCRRPAPLPPPPLPPHALSPGISLTHRCRR